MGYKETVIGRLARRQPREAEARLREAFADNDDDIARVAASMGVSVATVRRWMIRVGYKEGRIGKLIGRWPDLARRRLLEALDATGGNVGWAADRLGVSLTTIRRWIRRLDGEGRVSAALAEMRGREGSGRQRRRPRGYAEVG